MDMNHHLRRWLNETTLREMNDRYDGRIARVTEELIRNRFTGQKQLEPVIGFEDGWRLVPNIGQRRALIEFFGADTEEWIGRPLAVILVPNQRVHPETGQVRQVWEKRVMRTDVTPLRKKA
jgi:hypothetical protein